MQFLVAATLFASALAAPAAVSVTDNSIASRAPTCNGGLLYSVPMCCSSNVLNILGLDCEIPGPDGCGSRSAQCCSIPVAKQCVLANPS